MHPDEAGVAEDEGQQQQKRADGEDEIPGKGCADEIEDEANREGYARADDVTKEDRHHEVAIFPFKFDAALRAGFVHFPGGDEDFALQAVGTALLEEGGEAHGLNGRSHHIRRTRQHFQPAQNHNDGDNGAKHSRHQPDKTAD